jgi:hypothetical protein
LEPEEGLGRASCWLGSTNDSEEEEDDEKEDAEADSSVRGIVTSLLIPVFLEPCTINV